ncbi:MAG: hypothetical protein IT361_14790 [Gemmatimonadaceae bacterium]|nr:hypothetical protein [Gemmatimonadaceae bacterium]
MRRRAGLAFAAFLSVVAAAPLAGQGILLQLRPRAGDTLRVRLDQTIEISRAARDEGSEPGDAASLVILARIAVESTDDDGARVLALTDSVRITSSEAYATSPTLRAARALQGQRFRFRVEPDGSTAMGDGGQLAGPAVGSLFSQLPATLPKERLLPGASWVRAVELPLAAVPGGRGTATLNATFRLDSVSKSGEYAMLSVRGRLMRSAPLAGGAAEGFVQTAGDVSGKITIDLRRGWIAEARSVVDLQSVTTGRKDAAAGRVRVKITQWMRVL